MVVGLVGSGSIARSLALGWGEPVLCTDAGSGRARDLAEELGGEALGSNAELADRADLVVLCHKPSQLEAVAGEVSPAAKAIASVLAGRSLADLQAAYPDRPVFRLMPSKAVEMRRGLICFTPTAGASPELESQVLELFGRLGTLVSLPEPLMDPATALAGAGPAYLALVAEALTDGAVRQGFAAEQAATIVTETLAGTAELLHARQHDALAVRREIASPGGFTERGLSALETAGVRGAFADALEAAVGERTP